MTFENFYQSKQMKNLIAIPLILLLISCHPTGEKATVKKIPDHAVALKFINDYIQNTDGDLIYWSSNNPIISKTFRSELKRIIDKAEKEVPGYGLGFDPILNAQDYPESGFKLSSTNSKASEFVTVTAIEWQNFNITIKLIWENDRWLVDGSGIINIPIGKQADR